MKSNGGMIDVSAKDVTLRTAKASGTVFLGDKAFEIAKTGGSIKGDVIATARIAAIQAAKSTAHIIPMCHTVLIEAVDTGFVLSDADKSITVTVMVRSTGKTGVEMEALTAVGTACLTIYDMLKYVARDMVIGDVKLVEKSGGKSGHYKRQD